jgi:hypothetical protein
MAFEFRTYDIMDREGDPGSGGMAFEFRTYDIMDREGDPGSAFSFRGAEP